MPDQAIRQKRRTFLYLWVLLALLILLVASTYTWFSLSQTPHVNDMSIYINSQQGMEIAVMHDAPDAEWSQRIDFEQIVSGEYPLTLFTCTVGGRSTFGCAPKREASRSLARQSVAASPYSSWRSSSQIAPLYLPGSRTLNVTGLKMPGAGMLVDANA